MDTQTNNSPSSNPYDFFLNPNNTPLPPKTYNKKDRLIKILLLFTGFLIILMVILSFVLRGSDRTQVLKDIGILQTQIINMTDSALDKSQNQSTKNLATTAKISITSTKKELLGIAKTNNLGFVEKDLSVKNEQNDKLLEQALNNNRFDEVFEKILKEELLKYQASLEKAVREAKGDEKNMLESASAQIKELLTLF